MQMKAQWAASVGKMAAETCWPRQSSRPLTAASRSRVPKLFEGVRPRIRITPLLWERPWLKIGTSQKVEKAVGPQRKASQTVSVKWLSMIIIYHYEWLSLWLWTMKLNDMIMIIVNDEYHDHWWLDVTVGIANNYTTPKSGRLNQIYKWVTSKSS